MRMIEIIKRKYRGYDIPSNSDLVAMFIEEARDRGEFFTTNEVNKSMVLIGNVATLKGNIYNYCYEARNINFAAIRLKSKTAKYHYSRKGNAYAVYRDDNTMVDDCLYKEQAREMVYNLNGWIYKEPE